MEVMLPPWVRPESPETIRWIDDATVAFPPAFGRGMTQRGIYADPRWGLRRRYRGLRSEERVSILNALNETRGQLNVLRVTPHTPIRGSMPTSELLSNNTWASGTTGWTADSQYTHTVSDRVAYLTANGVISTGRTIYPTSTATCVQYAPYVARWMTMPGRGAYASGLRVDIGSTAGGGEYAAASDTDFGLISEVAVPTGTTLSTRLMDLNNTGTTAGNYIRVPYVSLARCALIDNAANLLTYSDQFDNAAWTKNAASTSANVVVAPDGSTTMDALTENSANAQHFASQTATRTSQAEDLCAYICAVRGSGTRDIQLYIDDGSANGGFAIFNLNTGVVTSTSTQGTGTNVRAFIKNMGSGRYFCWVVVAVPATTSARMVVYLYNGTSTTYTGDGASTVYLWRGGVARSSVPTIGGQTVGSALATGTIQTGSGIYTKGWPASTNGLLLAGEWIEINGELKQLVSAVNSDSAGLAYLMVRPGMAGSAADNDPVVIYEPFGRFIYPQGVRELENLFGIYGDCEMNLEEVYV